MASYSIPVGTCTTEIEVKRSRFIAYAAHTAGNKLAKAFIQTLKEDYPDARHHCYGFMAGSPWDSNQYGFSDDNEPSGTAGMPIFSHLKHNNIGEITIVVVRYFGGTKLGTGGLSRAYSDAAKSVLEKVTLKQYVETEQISLIADFSQEAEIRRIVEASDGKIKSVEYSQTVKITVEIPKGIELKVPYSVTPSQSTI
ncbi:IMPACT family protein [Oceaniserpentilla sp. 4NH20-0058]|uniref:YigZ family protein n=1 Tax=Oceaniserpentilla sp. 4NH20-0058 TaxID=3127660 RepID=UPI0031065089